MVMAEPRRPPPLLPRGPGPVRVGFYDIEGTLGKGNFAVVKLARHRITRSEVRRGSTAPALLPGPGCGLRSANLAGSRRRLRVRSGSAGGSNLGAGGRLGPGGAERPRPACAAARVSGAVPAPLPLGPAAPRGAAAWPGPR